MTWIYKNSYNVTINVEIGLVVGLKNNLVYIAKLQIKKSFLNAFVSLLFQNRCYFLHDPRINDGITVTRKSILTLTIEKFHACIVRVI